MDQAEQPRIRGAVVSSKGGTGKTTVTLALAEQLTYTYGTCHVADLDTQDEGSATRILTTAAEQGHLPDGLTRKRYGPGELADAIAGIPGPVIIDTPPELLGGEIATAVRLAGIVLIPGELSQRRTIIQTAVAVRAMGVPYAAVITGTRSVQLHSIDGRRRIRELVDEGVPVLGTIRHSLDMQWTVERGLLPSMSGGGLADDTAADIAELFGNFLTAVEQVNTAASVSHG